VVEEVQDLELEVLVMVVNFLEEQVQEIHLLHVLLKEILEVPDLLLLLEVVVELELRVLILQELRVVLEEPEEEVQFIQVRVLELLDHVDL
tara:strand:+ start:1282 stop:1554 length:273 start_codon:yes stop_codon:yes gene_type:complete